MKNPELPTPYELSRIAIALRGYDTKKEPLTALRRAMRVWFLACHEIGEAEKRTLSDNLEAYLISSSSEDEHRIAMEYPPAEDEALKAAISDSMTLAQNRELRVCLALATWQNSTPLPSSAQNPGQQSVNPLASFAESESSRGLRELCAPTSKHRHAI